MRELNIIIILLMCFNSNAQSTYEQTKLAIDKIEVNRNVTYIEIKIVQNSISAPYSNGVRKDNSIYVLDQLQSKFDYNYKLVNDAYNTVAYQEFVNPHNKYLISNWNNQVEEYVQQLNNVNWARTGDYAVRVKNWILQIYDEPSIKSEIILSQAIHYELIRLKYENPGSFHKTDRYFELMKAINELKTCNQYKISDISYKYGLF
jgi:hypothetical protein